MKRCFILVLASVVIAGCVSQYVRPRFDPPHTQFRGVADYLLAAPEVRMVVVHGMCTHDGQQWIDGEWDPQIRRALAATHVRVRKALQKMQAPVQVVTRRYAIGHKTLEVRFILWSNATAPLKKSLLYDDAPPKGEFHWRRASLNGGLKENLINDCLSDAVIYAGAYGPALRSLLERALCTALDLRYDTSSRECVEDHPEADQDVPTLFVTESLGSKMTFDALLDLLSRDGDNVLKARLASVPQMDMLANQLPLLDLAQRNAPSPGTALAAGGELHTESTGSRFATALLEAKRERARERGPRPKLAPAEGELSLVAFTDPNDLLSYRLRPEEWPQGVVVSNVLDSNAGTLFGVWVENPDPAHTGYVENARVMRLVLCGRGGGACKLLRRSPIR